VCKNERKSIEYLPLLSQWVRFAKNLWAIERGPTLASLDVVFTAHFVCRDFHGGRGFVRHVLLSAMGPFVAMSQTSMGSFRRKVSWADPIFQRRLATKDLSGLRLHFAAPFPTTIGLKVWVRSSHVLQTTVGRSWRFVILTRFVHQQRPGTTAHEQKRLSHHCLLSALLTPLRVHPTIFRKTRLGQLMRSRNGENSGKPPQWIVDDLAHSVLDTQMGKEPWFAALAVSGC
jgi:hypothetical protein